MTTPNYFVKFQTQLGNQLTVSDSPIVKPSNTEFHEYLETLCLEDWLTLISDLALQRPWPQMMKPRCPLHELLDLYVMDFQELSGHSGRLIEDACTRLASESVFHYSSDSAAILENTIRLTRLAGWGVQAHIITDQLLPCPSLSDSIRLSVAFALVTHRDQPAVSFWLDELDVHTYRYLGLAKIAALAESEPLRAFETFALLKDPPTDDFDIHTFKTLEGVLKLQSERFRPALAVLQDAPDSIFEYLKNIILANFRDPRFLGAVERRANSFLFEVNLDALGAQVEELCRNLLNPKEQTLLNPNENIPDHALGRVAQRFGLCSPHKIVINPYEPVNGKYETIYSKLFTTTNKRSLFLVITPPTLLGEGKAVSTQIALTNSYTGFALVGRSNINLKPFELRGDLVKGFLALMRPIMQLSPQIAIVDVAARDFVNILTDIYAALARRSRAPGPSTKRLYVLRSRGDAFVDELKAIGKDKAEFFVGPASSRFVANKLGFPTYITYRQVRTMLDTFLAEKGHEWCRPIRDRLEDLTTYNCWNINLPPRGWREDREKEAIIFRLASVAHRVSDMIATDTQRVLAGIAEDWNRQQEDREFFIKVEHLEEVFLDSYEFYTFGEIQKKAMSDDEGFRNKQKEIGSAFSVFDALFTFKRQFQDAHDEFHRFLQMRRGTLRGDVKERSRQVTEGAERQGAIWNYFDACSLQKLALQMVQQNTVQLALN